MNVDVGALFTAFLDYAKRLREHPDADPIELLHGHVCGPTCWHQQLAPRPRRDDAGKR